MNYLKNIKVYLSGPIENDNLNHNWRTKPVEILTEKFGIDVFDPFADPKQQWVPELNKARQEKDFDTMIKIAKRFCRKDLSNVDSSTALIAYLPFKVATTGTHHEIINANNAKKPTLLVSEQKENIPLWYWGFIPKEFMFGGWDELWAYLQSVNDGNEKHNNRWAITYGLL